MKLIYRFLIYFTGAFIVMGVFFMIIYPAIIPKHFLSELTWASIFSISGIMAIVMTYGDFREKETIQRLEKETDKE